MITVANVVLISKILGTLGLSAVNVAMAVKKKSLQLDIDEKTKEIIQKEGIYHFTTKENAEKIMESGFLKPSEGKLNNHFSKSRNGGEYANFVYMFAGKPNLISFAGNLAHRFGEQTDGTFYAIRHKPDNFEMANYTKRLSDGAITYEGRLDLENSHPEIVRMKMNLKTGELEEVPLNAKIEKESVPKRVLRNIATNALGLGIGTFLGFKEYVTAAGILVSKKAHKLIQQRRLANKMLEQLNRERRSVNLEIAQGDKIYLLAQGEEKIVDGKLVSEINLTEYNGKKNIKIYIDSADLTNLPIKQLREYFKKNIDFSSDLNQYIGKPVEKDGKIINEKDEQFEAHYSAKQRVGKNAQRKMENMNNERSKKQLGFFKKIYDKTNANERRVAKEFVKEIVAKSLSKNFEYGVNIKETEENDSIERK